MPAHRRLRDATRPQHALAESVPVMRALMHGTLSGAAYAQLLQAKLAFYDAWEGQRLPWLNAQVQSRDWHYQSRARALRRDLAERGVRLPMAARFTADTSPDSDAFAWGELYVIEGSALGGQLLLRQLDACMPDHAHHFFRLGLDAGRASWRSFQMMLDAVLPDEIRQQQAIAGARSAFTQIHRQLSQVAA